LTHDANIMYNFRMNKRENRISDIRYLGNEISKRRKLAKISQKDLADALGMTTPQLCKIEKGRNLASPRILARIEWSLGLNDGCLVELRNQIADKLDIAAELPILSDEERLLPSCDMHSIPNDELVCLTKSITPVLDEYVQAEESLGLFHFCHLNLGEFGASSERDGILLAEEVRVLLGVGDAPLRDLLPILEQKNIRLVFVGDLPRIRVKGGTKDRVAFSFYDRQYDVPVICVNRNATPETQLYNIAYELAVCLRFRKAFKTGHHPSVEEWWFARAFASTLLMPTGALRDVIDTLKIGDDQWTLRLLDDIAFRFGVSPVALVWRLKSLDRISNALFEAWKRPQRRDATKCQPLVAGRWLRTLQERARIA